MYDHSAFSVKPIGLQMQLSSVQHLQHYLQLDSTRAESRLSGFPQIFFTISPSRVWPIQLLILPDPTVFQGHHSRLSIAKYDHDAYHQVHFHEIYYHRLIFVDGSLIHL